MEDFKVYVVENDPMKLTDDLKLADESVRWWFQTVQILYHVETKRPSFKLKVSMVKSVLIQYDKKSITQCMKLNFDFMIKIFK